MDKSGEALRGKKLLILGASADELTLVERAKGYGVHTIVTDYYTDHRISPAKDNADEYWDISWSDIDALEAKCRERGVNGVCAGYSEFRVESQIKLCARLGLPCYITEEQLEITRNKAKFKAACRRNGVPVVKEYARPEEVDEYPVIVKPVDRGGSIGISVANDAEELRRAYDYAMEMSVCKRVIIEQYITEGTKIDVYYAILDGEIELLTSSDVINAKNNGTKRVVQSGWMFPSRAHGAFESEVDGNMRSMLRDMGVRNGYIFFSGFSLTGGGFVFFETGFRLCGGHIYEYCGEMGKINNLDIFIFHALTGSTAGVPRAEHAQPQLKCAVVNIYASNGIIGKIEGLTEIEEMEDCRFSQLKGVEGQKCSADLAILSKIAMFYFCAKEGGRLAEDVARAYERFQVTSTEGRDMVYDRMEIGTIETWWDG